jgi:hypothetical protein
MDSYQPIYDAVRSKITGANIGEAVSDAIRDQNWSHYIQQAAYAWEFAAQEQQRPCVVFKPVLSQDGNQWCALLGENLQDGIAGFGDSPADAMWRFDVAWSAKLPSVIDSARAPSVKEGKEQALNERKET